MSTEIQFPNPQGISCDTFTPPRDILSHRSRTLPELYAWCAEHNPQHPLFVFHDGSEVRTVHYLEAIRGVRRGAKLVQSLVNIDPSEIDALKPPVVAILATTDTITYWCFILSILWAGYAVFPISPRNGHAAVTHLLKRTGALHLFVSGEPSVHELAKAALDDIEQAEVQVHSMLVFEDFFSAEVDAKSENDLAPAQPVTNDWEAPILILHSSGSTAFPKPITYTLRTLMTYALVPWFGEVDFAGLVMGCHAVPMYHGMGLFHMCYAPACGIIIAAEKPAFPAPAHTSDKAFQELINTKADFVLGVPAFIEQWARDAEKVAHMKKMRGVIYGGSQLSKEVGDRLAAQGVNLHTCYGATEVGVMNVYLPKSAGADWDYFRFSELYRPVLLPFPDGQYELIITSHEIHTPSVINTKVGGRDGYNTNDLLVPHPTKPDMWKILGRADDQIMLSNGEKTNPGPLENILCQDPHIHSTIMFGRGRFQNGVLIDPKKEFAFDPKDTTRLQQFRNMIWPTVERMNEYAPQHSRLFKEMILVSSPDKPFVYTAKNTPRRQVIIAEYDKEIDALYDAVEQTSQRDISGPPSWEHADVLEFVRKAVTNVMGHTVPDDADIFQHGCDSLQATWIRNAVLRALRDSVPEAAKRMPVNFVFEAPSIAGIAGSVCITVGSSSDLQADDSSKEEELRRMVHKYTAQFPARPSSLRPREEKDVILVTGTTGGFGCDILAHLLQDETVARVYAVNRPGEDVLGRQTKTFTERGHDVGLLVAPKFRLVEGDLSVPGAHIEPALFNEIRNTVTHIIHNAWRVDFTLALVSFESNIRATRNLVDLALSSPSLAPPRLLFMSSIGILQNPTFSGPAPEEPLDDPAIAIRSGYPESKWVAERVLLAAGQQTELQPIIVRLGGVCGDRTGHWNEKEYIPSLIKSALFLQCLPDAPGDVSWLPAYQASKALTEMRNSPYSILHLVHPNPVPWSSIIKMIAEDLSVPVVPYEEWLSALKNSLQEGLEVEQMRENPALRLLDFYGTVVIDEDKEPLGVTRLSTKKTLEVAPSLNVPKLTKVDVEKWLMAWRLSGFLPSNNSTSL